MKIEQLTTTLDSMYRDLLEEKTFRPFEVPDFTPSLSVIPKVQDAALLNEPVSLGNPIETEMSGNGNLYVVRAVIPYTEAFKCLDHNYGVQLISLYKNAMVLSVAKKCNLDKMRIKTFERPTRRQQIFLDLPTKYGIELRFFVDNNEK